MCDRATIINSAGQEWDREPHLQKLTSRAAYVADALREKGLKHVEDATATVACSAAGPERGHAIRLALREWLAESQIQKICDIDTYVNGELVGRSFAALTQEEREAMHEVHAIHRRAVNTDKWMEPEVRQRHIESWVRRWQEKRPSDAQDYDLVFWVDFQLKENLMPGLTRDEREQLRDKHGHMMDRATR